MGTRCLPLLAVFVSISAGAAAQSVDVFYENGLVTISSQNAPLSSVFEAIGAEAGVELILEDAVKNKLITANLEEVPLAMAVQRLLEGGGVNYAVMMDPRDWGRVNKIFVGAGGGGPARSAAPPMRRPPVSPPEPVDEGYDDYQDDYQDDMDLMQDEMMDEEFEDPDMNMDDPTMQDEMDPGQFPAPPGSSPVPSYLPPQQTFPRSTFTPGLPNQNPQPQPQGPTQQPPQSETEPPPATMPFMDALGRPIPVPPGMNQQQQRRRQQQQPPQ